MDTDAIAKDIESAVLQFLAGDEDEGEWDSDNEQGLLAAAVPEDVDSKPGGQGLAADSSETAEAETTYAASAVGAATAMQAEDLAVHQGAGLTMVTSKEAGAHGLRAPATISSAKIETFSETASQGEGWDGGAAWWPWWPGFGKTDMGPAAAAAATASASGGWGPQHAAAAAGAMAPGSAGWGSWSWYTQMQMAAAAAAAELAAGSAKVPQPPPPPPGLSFPPQLASGAPSPSDRTVAPAAGVAAPSAASWGVAPGLPQAPGWQGAGGGGSSGACSSASGSWPAASAAPAAGTMRQQSRLTVRGSGAVDG